MSMLCAVVREGLPMMSQSLTEGFLELVLTVDLFVGDDDDGDELLDEPDSDGDEEAKQERLRVNVLGIFCWKKEMSGYSLRTSLNI
jgi:hypothetical protein